MKTIVLILISISIAIGGQFCIKHGVMNSAGRMELSSMEQSLQQLWLIFSSPVIWLGLSLYGLGAVTWMMVLSRADLSYAYPMLALGYVATTLLAYLFLQEPVTGYRWAGVLLITLGVILIGNEQGVKFAVERLLTLVRP